MRQLRQGDEAAKGLGRKTDMGRQMTLSSDCGVVAASDGLAQGQPRFDEPPRDAGGWGVRRDAREYHGSAVRGGHLIHTSILLLFLFFSARTSAHIFEPDADNTPVYYYYYRCA